MFVLIGAACVIFNSHTSYIAAVSSRFMQLVFGSIEKKVTLIHNTSSIIINMLYYITKKTINFENDSILCMNFYVISGRAETLHTGWSTLWWVPRHSNQWPTSSILLWQCHLLEVLLRTVLGHLSFTARQTESQANVQRCIWQRKVLVIGIFRTLIIIHCSFISHHRIMYC